MVKIDISLDDRAFQQHLAYIKDQLEKSILGVIQDGAQEIVNISSSTAPKRYGFLRASIGKTNPSLITGIPSVVRNKKGWNKGNVLLRYNKTPTVAPELKGVWRETSDTNFASIEVGSGMKYAKYMEYYHEAYSTKTKERQLITMREGRSPFLAPAFVMVVPQVRKALKKLITRVLNEKG